MRESLVSLEILLFVLLVGNAIISLLIMALQIPKAEGDLSGNVLVCDEKAKGKKRYIYVFKYSGVMEAWEKWGIKFKGRFDYWMKKTMKLVGHQKEKKKRKRD